MKREWKPGDLALVEAGCWANRKVALRLAEGWSHVNGVSLDSDGIVTPLRPLVVIDPEDSEAVERLAVTFHQIAGDRGHLSTWWTDLQDALREFADPKPPKPEEPTGHGAVIEDTKGRAFVRCASGGHPWFGEVDGDPTWRHWGQIDAVTVLSEGVTP